MFVDIAVRLLIASIAIGKRDSQLFCVYVMKVLR